MRKEGDGAEQGPRGTAREPDELAPASAGVGPLLQRDYWAVLDGCSMRPSEVMDLVSRCFERFAPEDVVRFARDGRGEGDPIRVGDVLEVAIAGGVACRVRAIHADERSFTFATLSGHPEAGRITFGSYRNDRGDVLFHIRSRARSSDVLRYVGFLGLGEAMQTRTWTAFVNRVAVAVSRGVKGTIRAETCRCEDEPDEDVQRRPTFEARGD